MYADFCSLWSVIIETRTQIKKNTLIDKKFINQINYSIYYTITMKIVTMYYFFFNVEYHKSQWMIVFISRLLYALIRFIPLPFAYLNYT